MCVMHGLPGQGSSIQGTVEFIQSSPAAPLLVQVSLSGLSPNQVHGIHVHERGSLWEDLVSGSSTGGHFIGGGSATHGLPDPEGISLSTPSTNSDSRHNGDMGNWIVSGEGTIIQSKYLDGLSLSGPQSVVGRAVVVHASEDTGMGASGDAGARIAHCTIGVAQEVASDDGATPPQQNLAQAATAVNTNQLLTASLQATSGCLENTNDDANCSRGRFHGAVFFLRTASSVVVWAKIAGKSSTQGLEGPRAMHIHGFGDISDESGSSSGGHFNPLNAEHAWPTSSARHLGDLGQLNFTDPTTSELVYYRSYEASDILYTRFSSIIGRAVVIHAARDCGGGSTGNAGARIYHGVIGLSAEGGISEDQFDNSLLSQLGAAETMQYQGEIDCTDASANSLGGGTDAGTVIGILILLFLVFGLCAACAFFARRSAHDSPWKIFGKSVETA